MVAVTARALLPVLGLSAAAFLRARARRRRSSYPFRGRTVLITGGSRGLGLLLAREFGRRGARTAICARDEQELTRAGRDLDSRGIDVLTAAADITHAADVNRLVDRVASHFGDIDVLVNNAGTIVVGPLQTLTPSDYEDAMQTHFWGPLRMVTAVLPGMRRRGGGRIVNISSIGGKLAVPHLAAYCASKFALAGLSQALRVELAKAAILVTTVYPGLMRTGSARHAIFKGRHRAEHTWFSVSGSLPFLSMNAERAAHEIVEACGRGDAEIVLSLPARAAVAFHSQCPEWSAGLFEFVNRLLPDAGGIGRQRAKGWESQSLTSPSPLTVLGDRAARAFESVRQGVEFE
jgi:NAD(P)-dependent dehydrogenase (short-subunit alcohol dehydrogenase family)